MFHVLPLHRGSRALAGRMWLAGIGYFGASLFWIIEPFFIEPEIHGWMAPFALVLMAGGMALFWGLAGALAAWVTHGRMRLIALAAGLVALELLRGWVFTGFPWAMVGHGFIGTPVMQLAAIVCPRTGRTAASTSSRLNPPAQQGRASQSRPLRQSGSGGRRKRLCHQTAMLPSVWPNPTPRRMKNG